MTRIREWTKKCKKHNEQMVFKALKKKKVKIMHWRWRKMISKIQGDVRVQKLEQV